MVNCGIPCMQDTETEFLDIVGEDPELFSGVCEWLWIQHFCNDSFQFKYPNNQIKQWK